MSKARELYRRINLELGKDCTLLFKIRDEVVADMNRALADPERDDDRYRKNVQEFRDEVAAADPTDGTCFLWRDALFTALFQEHVLARVDEDMKQADMPVVVG